MRTPIAARTWIVRGVDGQEELFRTSGEKTRTRRRRGIAAAKDHWGPGMATCRIEDVQVCGLAATRAAEGVSTCSSDLGQDAASRLIDPLPWDPAQIHAVVMVTQTPDLVLPATSCLLQRRLGLPRTAGALDKYLSAPGYIHGLWMGPQLIRGGLTQVLVFAEDTRTRTPAEWPAADGRRIDAGSATALMARGGAAPLALGMGAGRPAPGPRPVPAFRPSSPRETTSAEVPAATTEDSAANPRTAFQP